MSFKINLPKFRKRIGEWGEISNSGERPEGKGLAEQKCNGDHPSSDPSTHVQSSVQQSSAEIPVLGRRDRDVLGLSGQPALLI